MHQAVAGQNVRSAQIQRRTMHIADPAAGLLDQHRAGADVPLVLRRQREGGVGHARGDLRELVIGRRARGYVALYRYVPAVDTVFVLAIRGQKEAGYTND